VALSAVYQWRYRRSARAATQVYCIPCATYRWLVLLAAIVLMPLAAHAAAEARTPLRVQLIWTHQTQFAGFYLAEDRMFHQGDEAGFEIIEGGSGIDPLQRLIEGQADVAIGWLAHALKARVKGADIVNVAQIFKRPGMALACRRADGVRGAPDLAHRDIGVWYVGDEISVQLWLQRAGVVPGACGSSSRQRQQRI
jgi:NitT/TauT family transport system substrate-binding protein